MGNRIVDAVEGLYAFGEEWREPRVSGTLRITESARAGVHRNLDRTLASNGTVQPETDDLVAELKSAWASAQTLGCKFLIEQVLGIGGMGVVFAARHRLTGKRVAIKMLRPTCQQDANLNARFMREARVLATLREPGVVRLLDFDHTHDNLPFMVLELLEEDTLRCRLQRAPLSALQAVTVLHHVALALREVHALGMVHRDVKPENVVLSSETGAKLLDFGVVRVRGEFDAGRQLTVESNLLGSIHYMAPEQARNAQLATPASDVWSCGVMLFECLTQALPFPAGSDVDYVAAMLRDRPRSLKQAGIAMPKPVAAIVRRCLQRDPLHRFRDAAALVHALGTAQQHLVQQARDRSVALNVSASRRALRLLLGRGAQQRCTLLSQLAPLGLGPTW